MDPRHGQSASALKRQLELARSGERFVVFRDESGEATSVALKPEGTTIGRTGTDVELGWDPEVSRLHCEVRKVGGSWVAIDDGLSRNGTFVNGNRVVGRMRLADGDLLRVGGVEIAFADPTDAGALETVAGGREPAPELSSTQRQVLTALCRPLASGVPGAVPASNSEIAAELHLTVPGVKSQIRTLFSRFGVEDLPHNQKRARLAALAVESEAISYADLRSE